MKGGRTFRSPVFTCVSCSIYMSGNYTKLIVLLVADLDMLQGGTVLVFELRP